MGKRMVDPTRAALCASPYKPGLITRRPEDGSKRFYDLMEDDDE